MPCDSVAAVWHNLGGKFGTGLYAGYAVGPVFQRVWHTGVELQRHHAAGRVCDVVHCGVPDAAQRTVYACTVDAAMGLCHPPMSTLCTISSMPYARCLCAEAIFTASPTKPESWPWLPLPATAKTVNAMQAYIKSQPNFGWLSGMLGSFTVSRLMVSR